MTEHKTFRGETDHPGRRRREVCGIVLLAFSVFTIVSLYVHSTGLIGFYVRQYMLTLFGSTAIIFAISFLYISLRVFRSTVPVISLRKAFGGLLLLFTMATLAHVLSYTGNQLPPDLGEEIAIARHGVGAGLVGAVCMFAVLTGFGLPGAYIMLGATGLVGLIAFSGISLTALLGTLGRAVLDLVKTGIQAVGDTFTGQRLKLQNWQEERKLARLEKKQRRSAESIGGEENTVQILSSEEGPVPEHKKKRKRNAKKDADDDEQTIKGEQFALDLSVSDTQSFTLPPVYILKRSGGRAKRNLEDIQKNLLEETFASFGITATVVNVCQGPVVTRYELQPAPGIKVSRITSLADDLALALAAADVRIEAPVPGKPVIGIEVPNKETEAVLLRDVLESTECAEHKSKVALALGKDIAGNPVIADLKKWLHVLVAGSTGSGKSVCLNAIIASILFRAGPDEVKLLMVDPKRVELAVYDGIPHLISPVVTDPKKAAVALRWAVVEMERRYKIFAENGVRNIDMYKQLPPVNEEEVSREHLPYIVIIVDELADLMMVAAAEVEDSICRLAQMARAAGMYLIIATQRPSVDVITGLIKANVPSRIAFAVSSQVDSRTILDMGGAERLIGKGDMLVYPIGAAKPIRAQGSWISDSEVEDLVRFWKHQGEPVYDEEVVQERSGVSTSADGEDELIEDAIRLVVDSGQASISMLQRRFRIGYSRAARLIDMMEVRGIVGAYQGSKPREVLVDRSILAER